MHAQIEAAVRAMRAKAPIVHSITNFVVMEVTANALLAAGASPLMAQAQEEMEDLAAIVSALVLNIGTLDKGWIAAMESAAQAAQRHNLPIVLDPVGAGASRLRTGTAQRLLEKARPAVLRGNASEIMAVAGETLAVSKGVDSASASAEALRAAKYLAGRYNCVVSVSGAEDFITNGTEIYSVSGGCALMPRVTGMGCSATALTAAHLAAWPDPLVAAAAAMAVMAAAGEEAGGKAGGPGTFLPLFLDALHHLKPEDSSARVKKL